ncbi:DUF397 domain-containing protein [Micromonospora zhanjiangensis]|uniref:DUF397 domain-containing protein n=1 Tax=Micromonospora zhanjiangensis TaxID=1522057 RepID=A0ABV8KV81_9ACTN
MDTDGTARVTWRKSTRSNGSGDCVEVADLAGTIGVRDSKNPEAGVLAFRPAPWSAFLAAVKADRLTA